MFLREIIVQAKASIVSKRWNLGSIPIKIKNNVGMHTATIVLSREGHQKAENKIVICRWCDCVALKSPKISHKTMVNNKRKL